MTTRSLNSPPTTESASGYAGKAPTSDDSVNRAYDGLGATWQLYWSAFQRNSLDAKGLELVASVHYEEQYDNAFWDGQQMVFGDGDGTYFNDFTSSVDTRAPERLTSHACGILAPGRDVG